MLENFFIGPLPMWLLIFGESNLPHLNARAYFLKNLSSARLTFLIFHRSYVDNGYPISSKESILLANIAYQ